MKNIYIYLILTIAILTGDSYLASNDSTYIFVKNIEEEKEIYEENLYTIINREIDFYSYNISIGASIPISKNISDNFRTGESISLFIRTPYKSPKILNQFTFNVSSEISIKNFKFKETTDYDSNYNIFTIYLSLNTITDKSLKTAYGLGLSHINQANNNSLVPAFKLTAEYKLKLDKFYKFLINNYILNEKESVKLFLNKLNILIGVSPELILGFSSQDRELTLSLDIYCKINLFNL